MKEIFQLDGPLMRFLNTLADMITLSLLWLLCSLPVITVGASTVALYTITMRYNDDDSALIKRFFQAYKENLKKGSIAGLIFLVMAVLLFLDFRIIEGMVGMAQAMKIAAWAAAVICAATCIYTFPLLASFEQTLFQTLKNALFMAILNLPSTILALLLHAVPVLAAALNPEMFVGYALPFLSFMGVGIIAFLTSWMMKRIFAKYQNVES